MIGIYKEGKYRAKVNRHPTREYQIWRDMLRRAYSPEFHKMRPTYKDVEVEDYFLDFQNFAEFINNVPFYNSLDEHGNHYQIDKDLLSKDIKIYSRETICFIPQHLNTLLLKRDHGRGLLPIGVDYHKHRHSFRVKVKINGRDKHLGYFKNYHEAFNCYKDYKEALVKNLATTYFMNRQIEPRVYKALLNYEVVDDRSEDIKTICREIYG